MTKIAGPDLFIVLPPYAGPVQPTARVADPAVLAPPGAPICRKCAEDREPGSCTLSFLCLNLRTRRWFCRLNLILLHCLLPTDFGGPDPRLVFLPLLFHKL